MMEIFVPNKRARHRVPRTFSSANLTQKNKINPILRKQQIINKSTESKKEYKSGNKEEKCPETKAAECK